MTRQTEIALGPWLKNRREELGLTLRDVERLTEGRVSNPGLSQIESGKVGSPTIATIHQLAAVYAVDFEALCERAIHGTPKPPQPTFCETCGQVVRERAQ